MYSKIISQNQLMLVSLNEAKFQCRLVDFDLDDSLIESYIAVASDVAQSYTCRMLTPGVAVSELNDYRQIIQLPFGDVTAITELLLDGEPSTEFEFSEVTQKLKVNKPYVSLKVTYNAGMVNVPPAVKQAVLLTVATLYNNRENFITGLSVVSLPMTAERLLDTVKYYAI